MEARFNRLRAAVANRRWRARLVLWGAFALLAFALPYAPEEGGTYLYGLIGLSIVTGTVFPRAFLTTGAGIYVATLVRMATLPDALYPYISIEMAVVPIFAGLARLAVWVSIDRKYRTLVAEPLAPGQAAALFDPDDVPVAS